MGSAERNSVDLVFCSLQKKGITLIRKNLLLFGTSSFHFGVDPTLRETSGLERKKNKQTALSLQDLGVSYPTLL